LPVAAIWHLDIVTTSSGSWHPPLWLGLLGIPAGLLVFFVGLHLLNGWGWVCARWAELLFGAAPQAPAPVAALPPAAVPGALAPLVSVSAPPPPSLPPPPPQPPAPSQAAAMPAPPLPPAPPQPPAPATPDAAGSHQPESN
jgi:hypothetical protein